MSYILKLFQPFQNWAWGKWLLLSAFFAPIGPLVIVTTVLSIFDWITKLYCVLKAEGKSGIKSNKMQDTFFKIILYACFIATLFIVDVLFIKTALQDLFHLVLSIPFAPETANMIAVWLSKVQLASVGALMVLARELKSIDENWETAFGFSPIDTIYNFIKPFLKWKNSN